MQLPLSSLKDPSLLIIFAYAPAGLGHLRVTDALFHGLPKNVQHPFLLGAQNKSITALHRITSLNPLLRPFSEWIESGPLQIPTTRLYTFLLRHQTQLLYKQLLTIVNEQFEKPARILIIATHFALAHQLVSLKEQLRKDTRIRMTVIVQVTDDYPHPVWYVRGADAILVPSAQTKQKLARFAPKGTKTLIMVNPYPVSPSANIPLTNKHIEQRIQQTDPHDHHTIQVVIPISGAAIGTQFFNDITHRLHHLSDRFIFHIIVKDAPYTKRFISSMIIKPYIQLSVSPDDRTVIEYYENVYQNNTIGYEITKPSEQAFKALLDCSKRGASLLLFTSPVGEQEENNLSFLYRHSLIPSVQETKILWHAAEHNITLSDIHQSAIALSIHRWRGICLPMHPEKAARFIFWALHQNIFLGMVTCKVNPHHLDPYASEIQSNGVETFWEIVAQLLEKKNQEEA